MNIRIEDFVVAAVYMLWLAGLFSGRFSLKNVLNFKIIIFYLIYGLAITILGIFVFKTVDPWHLGILHWLRRVEYLGMYLVAATVLKRKNLKEYLYILLIVGILAWIYGVLQWKDIVPGVHTLSKSGQVGTYRDLGYVISTFAAHYDFGAFLILMSLLSWWGYFSHQGRKYKFFFLGLVLGFWWMALLAYARAAYMGLLVSAVFVLTAKLSPWAVLPLAEIINTFNRYLGGKFSLYSYNFQFKREVIQPTRQAFPTPDVVRPTRTPQLTLTPKPIDKALSPLPSPPQLTQRAGSVRDYLDSFVNTWSNTLNKYIGKIDINLDPSANIRLKEWPDRLAKVNYHFLWGGGYYAGGLGADNDYLRRLLEVGVIGLSVFLLILLDFIRLSWRRFRSSNNLYEKHFHLIMAAYMIGLLVEAVFIDIFAASKIAFSFWFLMGMVSQFSGIDSK